MAKKTKQLSVNPQMCRTCPFRPDGWIDVRAFLVERALSEGSPICHSTGKKALVRKPGQGKARLCRGAREAQLRYFYAIGFLDAPTETAWEEKSKTVGSRQRRNATMFDALDDKEPQQ